MSFPNVNFLTAPFCEASHNGAVYGSLRLFRAHYLCTFADRVVGLVKCYHICDCRARLGRLKERATVVAGKVLQIVLLAYENADDLKVKNIIKI